MKKLYGYVLISVLAQSLGLPAKAETGYVSDRLFLGIYAEPNTEGVALHTLSSGMEVNVIETQNGFVKIRTQEGAEGWTRARFISAEKPATLLVKELQAENKRLQAQPGTQQGSNHQEIEELKNKLAQAQADIKSLSMQRDKQKNNELGESQTASAEQARLQTELEIANATIAQLQDQISSQNSQHSAVGTIIDASSPAMGDETKTVMQTGEKLWQWRNVVFVISLITLGFIAGWQGMARKVRRHFNGIKVW